MLNLVVGLALSVVLVGTVGYYRWIAYRCQKRGHAWMEQPDGFRCLRCKLFHRIGA